MQQTAPSTSFRNNQVSYGVWLLEVIVYYVSFPFVVSNVTIGQDWSHRAVLRAYKRKRGREYDCMLADIYLSRHEVWYPLEKYYK